MNLYSQANVIDDITKCSGCFACLQICPVNAISVCENKYGHLFPEINADKCINCDKCKDVCPTDKAGLTSNELLFFGVRHNDTEILQNSTSGGLFTGLAEIIFSRGGVCYGAAYMPDYSVSHIRVASIHELPKIRGSKYAMSNTGDTFRLVCEDLKNGIPVLYSATSCIIDGLYSYLGQCNADTSLLYTCDLICSGAPGGRILREYVNMIESRYGKCVHVNLRDKSKGWDKHKNRSGNTNTYYFENDKTLSNDVYSDLYAFRLLNREICFDCPYVEPESKRADITMADFWGLEKSTSKTFYDDKGCSLAIVHSEKGKELLESGDFRMFSIASKEEAMYRNRRFKHKKIKQHKRFWTDYEKKGLSYCIRKYTSCGGTRARLRRKILMLFKQW